MKLHHVACATLVAACALLPFGPAQAQSCSGQFPPATACMNPTGAQALPRPTDITSVQLDTFLIIGASNAQGWTVGDTSGATSPAVPPGKVLQYSYTGAISDANDPTKNAAWAGFDANPTSAWPAFGLTYYNATGRRVG